MSKQTINILVNGILYSGSSALKDLIREYDNIGYFPNEFDDFRAPGLIADQLKDDSLEYPNEINKITKFKRLRAKIVYKLFPINPLSEKFYNRTFNHIVFFRNRLNNNKRIHYLKTLSGKLDKNFSLDKKIDLTKNYIQQIGSIYAKHKDYLLFDNPILTTTDVSVWSKVFKPFKLIFIVRDPRDQLADIIKQGLLYVPYGSPYMNLAGANIEAIYGRNRFGAIKFFSDAIKARMEGIERLERILHKEDILVMDFEGLIEEYDKYKSVLEKFLNVDSSGHINKNRYLIPEDSKNNIGIFENILHENEIKELDDLQKWYIKRLKNIKNEIL